VAGSEEPGEEFEDLFEGLDEFFAPIEQVDRPLREDERREGPDTPAPGPERAATGGDPSMPPPPSSTEPSEAPPVEEATGEMTGADWRRLRDALGEEEEQESRFLIESSSEALDEPLVIDSVEDEPGIDERGELGLDDRDETAIDDESLGITIEDLKKAPPQYADLPVSEESTEEAPPPGAAERVPLPAAGEGPPPVPASAGEGGKEFVAEPEFAEVEAAADRLAEEFGAIPEQEPEGEPELVWPGDSAAVDEELLPPLDQPPRPRTIKVGAETLTGPTWEEPTGSHPLMSEPPPRGGLGRNLPAAVITGAALVVVAAISLAVAKAAFAFVAGAIVLIGQAELYAAMHRKGYQPATALGLVVGGLVLAAAYLKGETAMLFFLALGLILSFLWYMAGPPRGRENAVQNIASTLLGIVYVPFLAGYALVLLSQPRSGRALMLAVVGLSVAYDIAAFFFGTFWGKHPLAPTISPKKSQEGLLGATIITFLLSIGLVPTVIKYLSLADAVGLALVISVFAPLGDLAESALKRDLGVKDMGAVLPGHGGVLDRIDSILFVAPAALYFLRLIL